SSSPPGTGSRSTSSPRRGHGCCATGTAWRRPLRAGAGSSASTSGLSAVPSVETTSLTRSSSARTSRRTVHAERGLRPWQRVVPAIVAMAWGGNHFTPLLLMYRQVDGYSAVEVDLFLAFYVLGLVPGFLVAGPVSDRVGRKPVAAYGLLLSVVASAILALGDTSAALMCIGRLVAGAGVACAMVVGTSWIEERSRLRFLRVVAPSAPWVFGVAALAYVVTPALVGGRVGGNRVAFSALLSLITLAAGAVVQPVVPRIAERTGGRQLVVGLGLAGL